MSLFDSSLPESRATESHNDWTTTTGSPHLRNRFIDEHEHHAMSGFPEVAMMTAPIQAAAVKVGDPHGVALWAGVAFRHAKTGSAVDIVRDLPDGRQKG